MKKLTLISLLSLVGCWDFQALSSGQTLSDAGPPPDFTMCPKTPNSLQEDCTNPDADINNNCLPGCLDPTCATHSYCLASKSSYRGTGTPRPSSTSCVGETIIHQNLATQSCATACSCNTPSCTGAINVYDQTNCGGTATKITFPPAMACTTVNQTTPMMPSVKLDPLTTTGCTPKAATVDIPPVWSGNVYLCENKGQNGLFADLVKSNDCLVFDGDTTCPTDTFKNKTTYYTTTTGMVSCACACAPTGTSCAINAGQVRVADNNTCATGGANKNMNVTQTNTCLPIVDATNASFNPKGVNVTAAAACQATGTVTATPNPSGQLTLCCK
ncbi:MAG TPA: hypothetical protein PKL17_18490 [Pseudomonadota bacterium]|jgi:hypothetical protein|nr:hypothetical protein [Pseudomonadota bacterium]HNK46779.1 hypothetical protein [Pseudomonadota bacterium]